MIPVSPATTPFFAEHFAVETEITAINSLRCFESLPLPLSDSSARILYCRCAFAQVIPNESKDEVLAGLCESGVDFESVTDLCEMAARKDDRLSDIIADDRPIKIAACFPRAVKWLFHQSGNPFPDDTLVQVLNMRDTEPQEVIKQLLSPPGEEDSAPASPDDGNDTEGEAS